MHWQDRLPAVQEDFQVRTFAGLKGSALLFQPPLHLLRVHAISYNRCVAFIRTKHNTERGALLKGRYKDGKTRLLVRSGVFSLLNKWVPHICAWLECRVCSIFCNYPNCPIRPPAAASGQTPAWRRACRAKTSFAGARTGRATEQPKQPGSSNPTGVSTQPGSPNRPTGVRSFNITSRLCSMLIFPYQSTHCRVVNTEMCRGKPGQTPQASLPGLRLTGRCPPAHPLAR